MSYRPIMSTLGYVLSPDRSQVLMTHRTARHDDEQSGKYNGLGGHMEATEDIASCMVREIHEEAGLHVTDMTLRGTVNWTGFGPSGDDWLAFIFLVHAFSGIVKERSDEGPMVWVDLKDLPRLPMWEGDRHFLPLVFDHDPRPFHGYLPYLDGRPQSWRVTRF